MPITESTEIFNSFSVVGMIFSVLMILSQLLIVVPHIKDIDAVFYTHPHADHLHGIDDLREINRIHNKPIDIFASQSCMEYIKLRFSYLLVDKDDEIDPIHRAALHPNDFVYEESFYFKDVKISSGCLINCILLYVKCFNVIKQFCNISHK